MTTVCAVSRKSSKSFCRDAANTRFNINTIPIDTMTDIKTVFVTGGAGYIGSHCVLSLLEAGYDVVAIDNFTNSVGKEQTAASLDRVRRITGKEITFYKCDLLDVQQLDDIFNKVPIHWYYLYGYTLLLYFYSRGAFIVGKSKTIIILFLKNVLYHSNRYLNVQSYIQTKPSCVCSTTV